MIQILKIYLSIILVLISIFAKSQHFSKFNRFSIEYDKGCTPTTVKITQHLLLDKPRSFRYESNLEFVSDTIFTYSTPGTYQIVQLIGEDIDPKTDTLTFTLEGSPEPKFEIYSCAGNQVEIKLLENFYDYYTVFINEDTVQINEDDPSLQYQSSSSSLSVRIVGHFNDAFNESCGESQETIIIEPAINTASINSASFIQNCLGSYSLNILSENISFYKYKVQISNENSLTDIYEGSLKATSTFENLIINSESEKCIYIVTIDPCNGTETQSLPYCLTPDLTQIGNFYGAYASYAGDDMYLDFGNIKDETVSVKRRSSGQNFTELGQFNSSLTDPISATRFYEYEISFASSNCDTLGSISSISPPYIKVSTKNLFDNRISLDITPPVNKLNSENISLSVLLYNEDSTVFHSQSYQDNFSLIPSIGEIQNIRLVYNYPTDSVMIYSNEVKTRINYIIHTPKAFTPFNNDGLNDNLMFFGLPTPNASVQIYNRWGELVYESNDASLGWNGKNRQGRSPQGTYRYKLSYETPDGDINSQVGTFVLLRE